MWIIQSEAQTWVEGQHNWIDGCRLKGPNVQWNTEYISVVSIAEGTEKQRMQWEAQREKTEDSNTG